MNKETRTQIFNYFWSKLSWDQRKKYVNILVEKENTKRQRNRTDETKSRRQFSWIYYLKTQNEQKFRVCKKMFLNTLGINEISVIEWKNIQNREVNVRINADEDGLSDNTTD